MIDLTIREPEIHTSPRVEEAPPKALRNIPLWPFLAIPAAIFATLFFTLNKSDYLLSPQLGVVFLAAILIIWFFRRRHFKPMHYERDDLRTGEEPRPGEIEQNIARKVEAEIVRRAASRQDKKNP